MSALVFISARQALGPAALFLAVAVAILWWAYRRAIVDPRMRLICATLKACGLLAIVACLLEPLWSGQRARPGANHFAVVADNSQGLRIRDAGETKARGDWLTNVLAVAQAPWLERLERDFQVRRYLFDTRLQSIRDFAELNFDGRATSLGAALQTLRDRFRGQPLAGVLLFTDGNATDLPDGRLDTTGLPPVYPVVVGRPDTWRDLAIQKLAVSQTSFEDAPVSVQADVSAEGYGGRLLTAQILGPGNRVVQEQTQSAGRDGATFRFQLRPSTNAVLFHQLRVGARDELGQFEKPGTSAEATLANNARVFAIDRGRGPYRVLYLSGRPNWEFKFLNRALQEDDQVELVALIRVARREPKFEFRGRLGETSNPLFRGFDRHSEETERYDQPVLKVVNAKDATELASGFPATFDKLYGYQAVILDDLEAEFFTRDQMGLLQKYVSERGGGLLMLGGAESFRQGHYDHTPVGDMLPVYLGAVRDERPATNLHMQFTREGWLQPWARLRDNENAETRRLNDMPALQILNTVRDVKPGARVIAEARDDAGRKFPALVEQRYGNGRVGALLFGDWWRWGLRDETSRKDRDKAWRQLVRWLIADVPKRVELTAQPKAGDPNQAMLLQVRARDQEFHPLDNAGVRVTVTFVGPDGQRAATTGGSNAPTNVTLTAEPSTAEPGLYEATYIPRQEGGYLASAVVTEASGLEAGQAQTGWASDPAAEEFRMLKPNVALLETLARQTGGEIVAPDRLNDFVANLANRPAPITETWTVPLWHQPAVLLFALACLTAEWGLRRSRGLA